MTRSRSSLPRSLPVTFTRPWPPGRPQTVNKNNAAERERRATTPYSMSDPSITVAEAFKQFSQVTVSAVGPGSTLSRTFIQTSTPTFFFFSLIFSFALTSMGLVQDSIRPRTICASCDMNATIRLEILTLAKNNLGPGSRK